MAEVTICEGTELPEPLEHQIRSFIRLNWYDAYQYDIDEPLYPPERRPRHVVAAERHALFAHARVSAVTFEHADVGWRLYCLGDVFTYPAFRRRGLGSEVTRVGTQLIAEESEGDLAILFCDPDNAGFYSRHGWTEAPDLRVTRGIGAVREPQLGLPMLMLLSAKAKRDRPDRSGLSWDLPGYGW
jgi:GNAT superfamily N-acetyltransferase